MKKVKLGFKEMKEVLSRDELRKIVGGFGSSGNNVCYCGGNCYVNGLPGSNCEQVCHGVNPDTCEF